MSRDPAPGPIWARPEPGERRPRFTREQIAQAALRIADEEGFEAVSMRRLASALGAGTMTLYHYVRTKADLVELMNDAIMAEVLLDDDELPASWRDALAEIARHSFGAFERHPWAFEHLQDAGLGPNGLRHFEQSLAAVSSLDLPLERRFEILTLVDDYVFGFVVRWAHDIPDEDEINLALEYVREQVATGEFPQLSQLLTDGDFGATWRRFASVAADRARFERGLQQLLDGIQAGLPS